MKKMHTPGPWRYQFEHGSYIIEAPSQTEPDKMHLVAELVSIEDTKLIATAPELFYLCERSLLALDEDSFPMLREQLRHAIAKVDGSQS